MPSLKERNKQTINNAKQLLEKIKSAKQEIQNNFSQTTLNKFKNLFEAVNIKPDFIKKKETLLNLLNAREKNIKASLDEKKAKDGLIGKLINQFKK